LIRWITEYLGGSRVPEPQELEVWQSENVKTVVNLLEGTYGDFIAQKQKEAGFEVIRIPFNMYDPIPEEEFLAVYDYINQLKDKAKIVVHCKYGKARSGTFLAGYLIYTGKDYASAIDEVVKKGFLPQTEQQLKFLQNLHRKVNGYKNP